MAAGAIVATQKLGDVVHAVHHDVQIAIIVEVTDRQASRGHLLQNAGAGIERHIAKA